MGLKLGPGLWTLICLGFLNGGVGPKDTVPTMPPFLRLGRPVFPDWKNIVFLICLCVPTRALLEGFLFLVTHLMRLFGVSHRFETPITGYRVMDSFVLLVGFEFSMGMYG